MCNEYHSIFFLSQIDILMKDPREGKTCLHLAAESVSSPSTIIQMLCRKRRQLIEETDIYGRTPLHLAAMSGNFEGLKALYAEGCNLNAIDTNEQYTALHWAAGWHSSLLPLVFLYHIFSSWRSGRCSC